MSDEPESPRRLFHSTNGGVDWSRMLEQALPGIVIGAVVIYANWTVMQGQVADLRGDNVAIRVELKSIIERAGIYNEKLVALSAQMTAYLGQQTQLNAAMDARMTYLERAQGRR